MHRMHRIFSGNGWLVILGSRKPAPDHRRSQLPAQQPLVLFILCILCIDVHKKISIPRRRPGSPPPHQGGEIPPGARASRPHPFSFIEAAERQREFAGIHPVGGNGIGQSEGDPGCCQSIQVGEMAEAVPGLVRAGRPRSRGAIIVRAGRPRSRGAIIVRAGRPRSRGAIIVRAGRPRSRGAIIVRAGRPRSQGDPFWALRAVEAAPYCFVALRGSSWISLFHSCPFVVRLYFLPSLSTFFRFK